MGATFTKLIPTAHLDIILCGGLCPWPTYYGRVTMVRKKWLSIYDRTYWCYIPQTCTNFSSWHDLPMSRGGLFPWPTFHAWVTMVKKKRLCLYFSTYRCYIHLTSIICRYCSLSRFVKFHSGFSEKLKKWKGNYNDFDCCVPTSWNHISGNSFRLWLCF